MVRSNASSLFDCKHLLATTTPGLGMYEMDVLWSITKSQQLHLRRLLQHESLWKKGSLSCLWAYSIGEEKYCLSVPCGMDHSLAQLDQCLLTSLSRKECSALWSVFCNWWLSASGYCEVGQGDQRNLFPICINIQPWLWWSNVHWWSDGVELQLVQYVLTGYSTQ